MTVQGSSCGDSVLCCHPGAQGVLLGVPPGQHGRKGGGWSREDLHGPCQEGMPPSAQWPLGHTASTSCKEAGIIICPCTQKEAKNCDLHTSPGIAFSSEGARKTRLAPRAVLHRLLSAPAPSIPAILIFYCTHRFIHAANISVSNKAGICWTNHLTSSDLNFSWRCIWRGELGRRVSWIVPVALSALKS